MSLTAAPALSDLVCAFEPNHERFAVVSEDNRIKVWEVSSGKLRLQCVDPAHLTAKYTCIAWAKPPRKASGQTLVAVGAAKGGVQLWDLAGRGQLLHSLNDAGSGRVQAVQFRGPELLAVCDDHLSRWHARSGRLLARHPLPAGARALALAEPLLFVGTNRVHVFRLPPVDESKPADPKQPPEQPDGTTPNKKKHKHKPALAETAVAPLEPAGELAGHASAVLALTSARGLVAAAAAADRFVHVWAAGAEDGNPTAALHSCVHDSPLLAVALNGLRPAGSKQEHLLATADDGSAAVWTLAEKSGKEKGGKSKTAKPVAAACQLQLAAAARTRVLAATFVSADEVLLVLGPPTAARVHFARVRYTDESGAPLTRVAVPDPEPSPSSATPSTSPAAGSKAKSSTLGPLEATKSPHGAVAEGRRKRKQDAEAEQPLGERLEALGALLAPAEPHTAAAVSVASPVAKADSVSAVLQQALHTNDTALLEQCLRISDPQVVANTIARLGPAHIAPLLTQLSSRLQTRPGRTPQLVTWLRAILVTHTAYVMSVPELLASLSGLYAVIDTRLGAFKRLLSLSGRLDLILSLKAAKGKLSRADAHAMAIYNEDEQRKGSDDEDDEDEEDEEDSVQEDESGEADENDEDENEQPSSGSSDDDEDSDAGAKSKKRLKKRKTRHAAEDDKDDSSSAAAEAEGNEEEAGNEVDGSDEEQSGEQGEEQAGDEEQSSS